MAKTPKDRSKLKPTQPTYRPAEVIEGAEAHRLPAVARSLAAAAGVMILLGSKPLLDWANGLPINGTTDDMLWLVQGFHDGLSALGPAELFARVQRLFRLLEALRF